MGLFKKAFKAGKTIARKRFVEFKEDRAVRAKAGKERRIAARTVELEERGKQAVETARARERERGKFARSSKPRLPVGINPDAFKDLGFDGGKQRKKKGKDQFMF